jgi:hypothetical protein
VVTDFVQWNISLYTLSVRKPAGKMKFVYRLEDAVEMDNKKVLCGGVD